LSSVGAFLQVRPIRRAGLKTRPYGKPIIAGGFKNPPLRQRNLSSVGVSGAPDSAGGFKNPPLRQRNLSSVGVSGAPDSAGGLKTRPYGNAIYLP
jgi:hypothetical protein